MQRQLEKECWEGKLAEHQHQAADSFQFFHSLKELQHRGKTAARQNPFSPAEWRDHFETISGKPEFLTDEIKQLIDTLPVSNLDRAHSAQLDDDLSDEEIRRAVRSLRSGAGGGDGLPPVVVKTLFADPSLANQISKFVRDLWNTPADQWQRSQMDGPGLQVPLWKQKEPFTSMDKWRGGCPVMDLAAHSCKNCRPPRSSLVREHQPAHSLQLWFQTRSGHRRCFIHDPTIG